MRHLLVLLPLVATTPLAHAEDIADRLKHLQGTSRPVIVLSDRAYDPRADEQLAALDRVRPALAERGIAVIAEAQPGSRLRRVLGVDSRGFAVVLVGKDGGVKEVWHDTVDPQRILEAVDAMPMRREEMRR